MRKTLKLAKQCGVSESTVYSIAKRIYELYNEIRLPTESEINNRQQLFYKKKGRPTKYKE